jgi:hypothetical protein
LLLGQIVHAFDINFFWHKERVFWFNRELMSSEQMGAKPDTEASL